ncbi:LytR/AlgR family response regulator transcription factor [Mucilaginibacter dorajii]|uniref:LytTR family DNA-binding domain-containing protein n=1 Tax=Mucilaginibacter dorajii TaxID=692994 RepID=A0ABP7R814_9SPHI|nr:LytTR family DNA-binding domain-containing protein [Mucilaginibacter dorajii]MCS3737360.1 two-component system LytT family response regulator [Mucilaginibacter dorajii]
MKKIRVLIVDDERLARAEVKRTIANFPDLEIVGEACNAGEARQMVNLKKPDLLLLDVQMPGESGFDLLETINPVPEVIFVTAFDQYAVKAFEANVLDYLVKPVRDERFAKAIEKVRHKLSSSGASQQIFVKDGDKCHFIKLSELYLIESMDNYARLYFNDQKTYIKRSLNQLEKKLDAVIFFRINRAQIINTTFIKQVTPLPGGKLSISLKTGELLEVSERQSVKFKTLNGL